jgi:hypothetical protein
MQILEQYFEALRTRDWDGLGQCLADDVRRTGPYLDVVRGKQAYVEFLAGVIPTLRNYELKVFRIRELGRGSALAELSETLDVDGVRREFPEALLFDFNDEGLILRVDIYIKQPPARDAGDG